jgi:hypothetical protein
MKYIAKIDLMRIEPDAPKGEELDEAVQSGLENSRLAEVHRWAEELFRGLNELTPDTALSAPWPGNAKHSWLDMLRWWAEHLERLSK